MGGASRRRDICPGTGVVQNCRSALAGAAPDRASCVCVCVVPDREPDPSTVEGGHENKPNLRSDGHGALDRGPHPERRRCCSRRSLAITRDRADYRSCRNNDSRHRYGLPRSLMGFVTDMDGPCADPRAGIDFPCWDGQTAIRYANHADRVPRHRLLRSRGSHRHASGGRNVVSGHHDS